MIRSPYLIGTRPPSEQPAQSGGDPVPDSSELPMPGRPGSTPPDPAAGARMCGGSGAGWLRWAFELDPDAVFDAIGRPQADWTDIDQDEDLAAELAACDREDAPAAA